MYENLLPRFLRYVKTETRSDATSTTTPSTQTQVAFAQTLKKELEELGMSDVIYNETNGFVIATLPSNVEKDVRSIGFIAHMDTAVFSGTASAGKALWKSIPNFNALIIVFFAVLG